MVQPNSKIQLEIPKEQSGLVLPIEECDVTVDFDGELSNITKGDAFTFSPHESIHLSNNSADKQFEFIVVSGMKSNQVLTKMPMFGGIMMHTSEEELKNLREN